MDPQSSFKEKIASSLPAAWLVLAALGCIAPAQADVVTDWNIRAGDFIKEAKLGPAAARRVLAVVQSSVYAAVNTITERYPAAGVEPGTARGASVDAAIAAANRVVLLALVPSQKEDIEYEYKDALAKIAAGAPRTNGIAVGQKSATAILASRASDLADPADNYGPFTEPTSRVATPPASTAKVPHRTPWLITSADALRPAAPDAQDAAAWARDYKEVKELGAKTSAGRTGIQTALAQFWEDEAPGVFYGLVYNVTQLPGREATQNARLLMAVAQAADDATIAALDASYAFNFWRPVTAIHNGDKDDSAATEPDPAWVPLGATPVHPGYPCIRCVEAAAVGAVIKAEVGKGEMPRLFTSSHTAPGLARGWATVEDLVREAADGRIHDGAEYRTSTVVGTAMGKKIGELAAKQLLAAPPNSAGAPTP